MTEKLIQQITAVGNVVWLPESEARALVEQGRCTLPKPTTPQPPATARKLPWSTRELHTRSLH